LAQTQARLKEASTGEYDFAAISNSVSHVHKRLNHASFTANVVIRTSGKKGRGLFATKGIKAGELILVEKAFLIAFESYVGPEKHVVLNLDTNTRRIGAHAVLFNRLVQKLLHNPT
jgi:hypothetical protein